ncbi:MAG: DUF4013 domain-containing protein [archaeon]
MGQYIDAIQRPFSDWKKLGITFLLFLVPVVNIITGFFAQGYFLECANSSMKKKKKLPEFKDWGDLFVKGLIAFAITLIYLIPVMILAVFSAASYASSFVNIDPNAFTFPPIPESMIPLLIATLLVMLFTMYIMPAVVMMFAKNYKFKDSFEMGTIFSTAFTLKYLGMWGFVVLFMLVLLIISQGIAYISNQVFVISIIVNAFLNAFIGITIYTIYGHAFKEITS